MVARAVSPTRAATSTMLAETMADCTAAGAVNQADTVRHAPNHWSGTNHAPKRCLGSDPIWRPAMKRASQRAEPISIHLERHRDCLARRATERGMAAPAAGERNDAAEL